MTNTQSTSDIVTRHQVTDDRRVNHAAEIFGIHFSLRLEPYVYAVTGKLARNYTGGYWEFYTLSNGGFYMAPRFERTFHVISENSFEGDLSADALGITACLYGYSHLSFGGMLSLDSDEGFAETCAWQYHWLRDYMLGHPEAAAILGAID